MFRLARTLLRFPCYPIATLALKIAPSVQGSPPCGGRGALSAAQGGMRALYRVARPCRHRHHSAGLWMVVPGIGSGSCALLRSPVLEILTKSGWPATLWVSPEKAGAPTRGLRGPRSKPWGDCQLDDIIFLPSEQLLQRCDSAIERQEFAAASSTSVRSPCPFIPTARAPRALRVGSHGGLPGF
jgi:hypothetical protein